MILDATKTTMKKCVSSSKSRTRTDPQLRTLLLIKLTHKRQTASPHLLISKFLLIINYIWIHGETGFNNFKYISNALSHRSHGLTHGLSLKKNRRHEKIKVNIPNNSIGGVDDSVSSLSSCVGTLVRAYASFYLRSWQYVPNEVKDHIQSRILVSLYTLVFLEMF